MDGVSEINLFVFLIIFASAFGITEVKSQNSVRTFEISSVEKSIIHRQAIAVMRVAYERIGISIIVTPLPTKRSLLMADRGDVDGEAGRIPGTEKQFTNLIPITSAPIAFVEGGVFSKTHREKIRTWSNLKGLKVAIRRGELYAEKGTRGLSPLVADHYPSLIKLLMNDRIDVFVGIKSDAFFELRKNPNYNLIKMLEPPLYSAPLFHLVHKKNKDIVPRLEKVIFNMQKQGEIKRIHNLEFSKKNVE